MSDFDNAVPALIWARARHMTKDGTVAFLLILTEKSGDLPLHVPKALLADFQLSLWPVSIFPLVGLSHDSKFDRFTATALIVVTKLGRAETFRIGHGAIISPETVITGLEKLMQGFAGAFS